jgi:integrase
MSRRAKRSDARANALVSGDRADNPEVSLTSRFWDDVWDFSKEDANPAMGSHDKRIYWSFKMPGGGLFTDARFRSLLTASKHFVYALRWHPVDGPAHAPAGLRNLFRALKPFIAYLVSCSNPVFRFKDVLPHHCEDYIQKLVSSDAIRSWKYKHVQILQKLFQYRGVTRDGLVIDPLQGESAAEIVGKEPRSFGSKTEIIPEEILGPLVRASLQYVERFADYLLDASDEVEAIRSRMGPDHFLYFGTRCLRRLSPAAYPLGSTQLEKGVRSLRRLSTELSHLQTACFVLIAFATGMRLSELLSLREGCCQTEIVPGQPDLVWLHSRVFKMQGMPDGRKAKWLGGPVCAKAVHVLERLGRKVRRRARVTKRGASGVRNINATLHAMACTAKPKLEGWGFAEGDPIIYLVNDYQKELWNGSLGRIECILISNGRRSLLCCLDGARQEIPEEDFHRIDLAYAITVHKAQGSQFKRVIVPIVRSRLLDRTLIYTALTRGMEQVVFIGDRDAFDAAVTAPPHSRERQVGFSLGTLVATSSS